MEHYVKFMSSLAIGLMGVGLVLKVLLETIFNEWDAFNDVHARFQAYISGKHHVGLIRPEDILLEAENRNASTTSTRLLDQRRHRLKELDDVETRLNLPAAPQPSDTLASILPS